MLNSCGNIVDSLWQIAGKKCVQLSTVCVHGFTQATPSWITMRFLPQTLHDFYPQFSAAKIHKLPLKKINFSTLSTTPIITTINYKKGIR